MNGAEDVTSNRFLAFLLFAEYVITIDGNNMFQIIYKT